MRTYLRPAIAVPYAVALGIAVVTTVFFGWAGFWLGAAVIILVRLGRWGIPLIRLSYQPAPQGNGPDPADPAAR